MDSLKTDLEGPRNFSCQDHNEKKTLFCRDCRLPVCTVCCSIKHWACKEVVTMDEMLPTIKGVLIEKQKETGQKMEDKAKTISGIKQQIDDVNTETSAIKLDIDQTFNDIKTYIQEKERKLKTKVDTLKGKQTDELVSKLTIIEREKQLNSQQSQLIQQALESEDEAQLFEMYLSSGSGGVADVTETQREDSTDVSGISFILDLGKLKEEIEKMDVQDGTVSSFRNGGKPVQTQNIHLADIMWCLMDVALLHNNNRLRIILAETSSSQIVSIDAATFPQGVQKLVMDNEPGCVTVLNRNEVVVSVKDENHLLVVKINPDLEIKTTISTEKSYFGLAVLDDYTLVASSEDPPSVDILDMDGNVTRTLSSSPSLQGMLTSLCYLHVTRQGNIIMSDMEGGSIICVTKSGEVRFVFTLPQDSCPFGITSTECGDILVSSVPAVYLGVERTESEDKSDSGPGDSESRRNQSTRAENPIATHDANRIIHLSESGEFLRDLLTSRDGVVGPTGLWVEGDTLYVATVVGGLRIVTYK